MGLLVSELLVDDVCQWFSPAKSLKLSDEEAHGIVQPVGCVVGAVGR